MKTIYLANDQVYHTKNFYDSKSDAIDRINQWGKKGFVEEWTLNEETNYWEYQSLEVIGENIPLGTFNAIGPRYPKIANNCIKWIWGYDNDDKKPKRKNR